MIGFFIYYTLVLLAKKYIFLLHKTQHIFFSIE